MRTGFKQVLAGAVLGALAFALPLRSDAQTDGSVAFTVTTSNVNGGYNPRNVMAIWVVNSSGTFVKTLKRMARTRIGYLTQWNGQSGGNVVDAVTGATLGTHETHNVTWNCRDVAGAIVPDGTYRVRVEFTTINGAGPYSADLCQFVKGTASLTNTYANMTGLSNMRLVYTPVMVAHDLAIVSMAPSVAPPNALVPVTIVVSNREVTTESFSVVLSNLTTRTLVGTAAVTGLTAGRTTNVVMSWSTPARVPVAGAAYTLSATAGPQSGEINTADNKREQVVIVRNPVHDVGLSSLQVPTWILVGSTASLSVTATNVGDVAESVTVTLRDATDAVAIGSKGASLAPMASSNLTFSWNTAGRTVGTHTVTAAVSAVTGETSLANNGLQRTLPLATGVVTNTLVATNAVWRFNDQGLDLHRAPWTALSYYSGAWGVGPAELGYGDGDEATVISYGPLVNAKYPTSYFRREFTLDGPPLVLAGRVRRDDGVAVYLNEREVLRDNLPTGMLSYTSLAVVAIDGAAETNFTAFTIDPDLVRTGRNVIAAEVHQQTVNSTDLSFALELRGTFPVMPTRRDLAVSEFSADTRAAAGDRVRLHARVENRGQAAESFTVVISNRTTLVPLASAGVSELPVGEGADVDLDWDSPISGAGSHELRASVPVLPGETVTNDNTSDLAVVLRPVASAPVQVEALAGIGGYCGAVALDGPQLIAGAGSFLVWMGEAMSQPVAQVLLPGVVRAVVASNGWVWAACGPQGVQVVDARAMPPRVVATLDTTGEAESLALRGTRLYVADGVAGLRVFDVSDPALPSLAGALATAGPATDVALGAGAQAGIADGYNGLQLVDAATLQRGAANDQVAGATHLAFLPGSAHVLMLDASGALTVINVSGALPTRVARVELAEPGRGLLVQGSRALVACGATGLLPVDLANPAQPVVGAAIATRGDAEGLARQGSLLAVAEGFTGVEWFDSADLTSPTALGAASIGGRARGAAVTNGLLAVAAGVEGLRVYSITNPASPRWLSTSTNATQARAVAIEGTLAAVADGQSGLRLIGLADPTHPVLQATYQSADLGSVAAVASGPGRVVITDGRRLEWLDAAVPTAPVLRGAYASPGYVHALGLSDDVVVAAAGEAGLLVLRLDQAGGIVLLAQVAGPVPALDVDVRGTNVLVAAGEAGWFLYDLSTPAAPQLLQQFSGHATAQNSALQTADRVLTADASRGLHALQVRVLTPVQKAQVEPLARALSLAAAGPLAVVSLDDAGLAIVDASPGDRDMDNLRDTLEQRIVDANPTDALASVEDVRAGDDFDGDGLNNLAEQIAGTDLVDPASVFAVLDSGRNSGGFTLSWASVAGKTYTVRRATDLRIGFSDVATGLAATPPTNTYTDPAPPDNAFYLVTVD